VARQNDVALPKVACSRGCAVGHRDPETEEDLKTLGYLD
jgi:hypothetical protein